MATQAFHAYKNKDVRTVGNVTSSHAYVQDIPNGAVLLEDVDNFTLVELSFDANGERAASSLTDVAKKGYLIASPERRYLGELISEFYNGEGERGRIIILTEGLRFESSAFELSVVTEVEKGQFAHFDPATKKFLIHDGTHADYANAVNKLLVVSNEEDITYTLGFPMVRFEVI